MGLVKSSERGKLMVPLTQALIYLTALPEQGKIMALR